MAGNLFDGLADFAGNVLIFMEEGGRRGHGEVKQDGNPSALCSALRSPCTIFA